MSMNQNDSNTVSLKVELTDFQAERLQERFLAAAMKLGYQEEQHGPALIASIRCTPAQEKTVRAILQDVGISLADSSIQE